METGNVGEVDHNPSSPSQSSRGTSRLVFNAVGESFYSKDPVIEITYADILRNIANTKPDDVQQNAANQTAILTKYYSEVLDQAKTSFKWAVAASVVGLAFFVGAVIIALSFASIGTAAISIVSGAIVEVIAGINFYLYGKTTAQLSEFHQRLDQTQRFLLANSICSQIGEAGQQTARAELVQMVATGVRKEQPTEKK